MLLLTIDSATPVLALGLVRDGTTLAQCHIEGRRHNEQLTPAVVTLLAEAGCSFADLHGVVTGCGPGPFTGLRVGMASAVAFADALGIPVTGVNTHLAMAAGQSGRTLVITDARRKEVYYTLVDQGQVLEGPEVCKPAELPSFEVDRLSVPAHLAEALPEHYRDVPHLELQPEAEGLAAVADLANPSTPVPLYLRRPDAKVPTVKLSSAVPVAAPDAPA